MTRKSGVWRYLPGWTWAPWTGSADGRTGLVVVEVDCRPVMPAGDACMVLSVAVLLVVGVLMYNTSNKNSCFSVKKKMEH